MWPEVLYVPFPILVAWVAPSDRFGFDNTLRLLAYMGYVSERLGAGCLPCFDFRNDTMTMLPPDGRVICVTYACEDLWEIYNAVTRPVEKYPPESTTYGRDKVKHYGITQSGCSRLAVLRSRKATVNATNNTNNP